MTGNTPVPTAQFLLTQLIGDNTTERRARWCSLLRRAPRTGKWRQEYAQLARDSCSKFRDRCVGRKADRASFFLPQYTALDFSKEKFIPDFILPTLHPSSLLCLFKNEYFTGCSSEMNHRPISELPATTLLLTQQFKSAVFADCSTKGWHHLNIQVCIEKNSFYIFCVAAAEFADKRAQGQDRSRNYRWYRQLWMSNKGKPWLFLKKEETRRYIWTHQTKIMFEHLELHCGWMVRKASSVDKNKYPIPNFVIF